MILICEVADCSGLSWVSQSLLSRANILRNSHAGRLEAQKKQILASIERAKLQTGLQLTKDHILYFLRQFRTLNLDDLECQKRLIATFINSVFVYDDRITITFNYSGDNRTVTLAEIDGGGFDCSASCSTITRRYEHLVVVRNVFAVIVRIGDR